MSATMARQGDRIQLEQSNMRLPLDMARTAQGGLSCAALEETKQLIKIPRTEVREEKKSGVQIPGHNKVKAAIARHQAKVRKNQTDGCHSCQSSTAKNPQIWCRR
jgi:hypothetical protein